MASDAAGESRAPRNPSNVRRQLDLILASPEFHAPERGRRFLQYIVEETLQGRGEQLKAYTIAQAVFGRDASFDAQNDPVVRIEAGRIRRALERYYLVCANSGAVRITIPKGGYSPQFSDGADISNAGDATDLLNHANKGRSADWPTTYRDLLLPIGLPALLGAMAILAVIRPLEAYLSPPETTIPVSLPLKGRTGIVVEPFASLGASTRGADFAKGLADQLIAKLTKVENLVVLTPGRSGPDSLMFNLQGSALVDGTVLHLHARLINGADGTVIWANQYDRDLHGQAILDVQDELAAQIANEISNSGKLAGTDTAP